MSTFRNGATGTGVTVTKPTGTASGDIWVIVAGRSTNLAVSIDGFTREYTGVSTGDAQEFYTVWWRKCDGSEGSSVTITGASVVDYWVSVSWSTTGETLDSKNVYLGSPSSTTVPLPDLTVVADGCLEVEIAHYRSGAYTWSGWTVGAEVVDSSNWGVAWRDPSAGASNGQTVTMSDVFYGGGVTVRLAFAPSSTPPLTWYDHTGVAPWSSIWRPGRV